MHGAEITAWLEARSSGHLDVEESALYHALHRMEERALIAAEWGLTDNNRRGAASVIQPRSGRAGCKCTIGSIPFARTFGMPCVAFAPTPASPRPSCSPWR